MSTWLGRTLAVMTLGLSTLLACGARSELGVDVCTDGETVICGSDVGACRPGKARCIKGHLGPCEGSIGPVPETCNDVDDNCDGQVDEGFHLGEACDGPDKDLCLDDVMTCDGCSKGPDKLEVCNGVDDNCNGIIDADCDTGDCKPTLVVTGSTPSSPNCVDEPVTMGSDGVIEFPCQGGPVSAKLGEIEFTGFAKDGQVSLTGVAMVIGPDGCLWEDDHFIEGSLSSGELSYSYAETMIDPMGQPSCWSPCTETGTVEIKW
ncbi:MAG: MopE-related protein [Byssovorax sp.]